MHLAQTLRPFIRSQTPRYVNTTRAFYLWLNYLWLNNIFNRVDEERQKLVGHERVAAEWILRCGGGVKFLNSNKYIWDYNALPEWSRQKYQVDGIDAKNTYITDGGLDHLVGLQYLRVLNLNSCRYICDLSQILPVKNTLEELDIGNCGEVTDLSPLAELKNLKALCLSGITSVKNMEFAINQLEKKLPDCEIT